MTPRGLYIVGALGEVAGTVLVGQRALAAGLIPTTGLVTETSTLARLNLPDPVDFVLGGVDIREEPLEAVLWRSVRANGAIPWELWIQLRDGGHLDDLPRIDLWRRGGSGEERLQRAQTLLQKFCAKVDGPVVVLHLASTEPPWKHKAGDLEAMFASTSLPDSMVWACAAAQCGCAHVNFTPSSAFDVTALQEAWGDKIPWAGNDGKTGETLLKSVLAPMFAARNLDVLSWEGLNLLGNADGASLRDPQVAAGKISNKQEIVEKILRTPVHSTTRIAYTPSLGDWKTAWNLIHFQGFMDIPMTLQLTWQGCDSALAAPLCLDLARLAHNALDHNETGPLHHADVFFKNPVASNQHAFAEQMSALTRWAARRV